MRRLQTRLDGEGYPTWSMTYPSRRQGLGDIAAEVARRVLLETEAPRVAVTHSLGGIVARFVAAEVGWQRVCMIAPPNNGSSVARRLGTNPMFRWMYGPAGQEVSDASDWPIPRAPMGVIAGTRRLSVGNPTSWVTSWGLISKDQASDGTVCVAETRMAELTDFVAIDASHTWIMRHPDTLEQVVSFLDKGAFRRTDAPAS